MTHFHVTPITKPTDSQPYNTTGDVMGTCAKGEGVSGCQNCNATARASNYVINRWIEAGINRGE